MGSFLTLQQDPSGLPGRARGRAPVVAVADHIPGEMLRLRQTPQGLVVVPQMKV